MQSTAFWQRCQEYIMTKRLSTNGIGKTVHPHAKNSNGSVVYALHKKHLKWIRIKLNIWKCENLRRNHKGKYWHWFRGHEIKSTG